MHAATAAWWPRVGAWAALVAYAAAYAGVQPALGGLKRAAAARGVCGASMCSGGTAPTSAPPTLSRRSALQGLVLLGLPSAAIAKDKKAAKSPAPETSETMSLDEFYAALEDQEVLKVEFDGPKFEVGQAPQRWLALSRNAGPLWRRGLHEFLHPTPLLARSIACGSRATPQKYTDMTRHAKCCRGALFS